MQPRPIAETSRSPIVRRSIDPAFHQGLLIAQRLGAAEECGNVSSEELRLLSRHEMPAARHDRPAADVVQPFGPLPRRGALWHELFSYGEPGGHRDIVVRAEFHAEPAVVVVIPHRWCDAPRHPIDREYGQQEIPGEQAVEVTAGVGPRPPFLEDPGGKPRR